MRNMTLKTENGHVQKPLLAENIRRNNITLHLTIKDKKSSLV
jgi:hypothetical protein